MFCIAGGFAVFVLRDASKARLSNPVENVPETAPVEFIPPPKTPEEKSAAAMAAFDGFLAINDPARRLPLVFDPVGDSAAFLDYYGHRARKDPESIHDRKVTAVLDKDREILIVTFRDAQKRKWAAPFEWNVNGYRLHWGAMTGYGELPWDRFLAERPAKPVRMRVNLYIPDAAGETLVPDGHMSVLITHPELTKPIGALLSPSPTLEPLLALPRNSDIPANVSMQWRDFEGSGTWPVVTDLIHRNWITP